MGLISLTVPLSFSSSLVTIGYQNLAELSDIVVSSVAAGSSALFLRTWTMQDAWTADGTVAEYVIFDTVVPRAADYLGIFGHNLGTTGNSYKLESANDIAGPWTTRLEGPVYQDNVIFERFTQTTARFWRLSFPSGSSPPFMSIVSFGLALELERGLSPGFMPPIVDQYRILNSESNESLFIGRSVRKIPLDIRFTADLLSATWVRAEWAPFLEHASRKPFFFSWNDEEYPQEAVIGWTEKDELASYRDVVNMRARLRFNALRNLD